MTLNLISNENNSLTLLERIRARLNDPDLAQGDLLISYIMKSGVDLLGEEFEALQARNVTVRILTTCQHGISDFEGAVERLARLKRFEIKVFTPNNPTFHAKGWRFEYRNGASRDAILVGSSNLSRPALTTGQEFNIEVERGENDEAAKVIANFRARFDDYWQNTGFVSITGDNFEYMRKQFKIAANGDHFLQGTPYQEEYDSIMQQQRSTFREKAKQWNERERVNKHPRSKSVTDAEQGNVRRPRLVGPAVEYPLRGLNELSLSTLPLSSSSSITGAPPERSTSSPAHTAQSATAQPQLVGLTGALKLRFIAAVKLNDVDDLVQILSKLDAQDQATLLNTRHLLELPSSRARSYDEHGNYTVFTLPIWHSLEKKNYRMLKVMLEKGARLAPLTILDTTDDEQSTYQPLITLIKGFIQEAETQLQNMRAGRPIEMEDIREGDNRLEEMLGYGYEVVRRPRSRR
ncbi:hypothetical protein LTR48_003246 [Friedmanniomyces endolithicus]|uniref:Phospholipase D-like domain-containing protein n=1 Tax=Rachicladosporium monterosium TaxID=1507873 RepID=A0ABR0L8W0_9PEZI|nr:hypothetical protein LTR48_003246 [Friedmanniomyces endolithicus]KAK5145198.1 hypothetical protein LTR32_003006 [Rachicladosporium monterosium]